MIVISQDMGVDLKLYAKFKDTVHSPTGPSPWLLAPPSRETMHKATIVTVVTSGSTQPDRAWSSGVLPVSVQCVDSLMILGSTGFHPHNMEP